MFEIIFISLGAILGANTRFKIANNLKRTNQNNSFFVLRLNTFSSFSLGLFLSIIDNFNSNIYTYQLVLFFSIGFLGSLSTFSSFIYELFDLCLKFKFWRALNFSIISLSLGIIAFAFGFLLGHL